MLSTVLIPALALSAGLFFLLPRKENRLSCGEFLDDIIPELDRFLSDFPQLFPQGSYAVAPGALPSDGEGIGEGAVAFCEKADIRCISIAGREELRTYFFRDASAYGTMQGFMLGIAEELDAAASGVRFYRREKGKLSPVSDGEVRTIAEDFKREYGLL